MENLEDQYGYDDEIFISETPDYLRCVVCVLVLRDPVQILSCGHKMCSVCFQRLKAHVEQKTNTDLSCPTCRDLVDLSDVRDDIAMRRVIGNLTVRCSEREAGCDWTGDLREHNTHFEQCSYRQPVLSGAHDSTRLERVMSELQDRVSRCEGLISEKDEELAGKEKQIALLNHNFQELTRRLDDKDNQMAYLKQHVDELRERYENNDTQVATLKQNLQEVNDKLEVKDKQIAGLKVQFQSFQNPKSEVSDLDGVAAEVGNLKQKNIGIENTLTLLCQNIEEYQQSIDKLPRKPVLDSQITALTKKVDKALGGKQAIDSRVDLLVKRIDNLEKHTSSKVEKIAAATKTGDGNISSVAKVQTENDPKLNPNLNPNLSPNPSPNPSSTSHLKPLSSKIINIQRQRGERNDTKFSMAGNHRIHFKDWSTVCAPHAWIRAGMKAFYEIELIQMTAADGRSQIGWASSSLTKINDATVGNGVGDVSNSYAFDPQCGELWISGKKEKLNIISKSQRDIIGIALDLRLGAVYFGINSVWRCRPLNGSSVAEYFPAVTASDFIMMVNFGDRPFKIGPPDDTYKPVNSLV